jgi:ATP-binding cassette, subfamily B, bacterial
VARGETIAFVGLSGAGKTSLVKLLVGLYRPKSGHIFYNGTSEDQVAIEDLRERIGFVTQHTQPFSGSIRENLQFVRPDATDEECLEVLRQGAVEGLLLRANHGLDSKIGEGGVKVSGGEKQRLSIARTLLRRPQLLVFDEATSSLDSLTEEKSARPFGMSPRRDHDLDRPPALYHPARGLHLRIGTGANCREGP